MPVPPPEPHSGGGGLDPATASRLAVRDAGPSGIASGATAIGHWSIVNEQVGTDLTVDGGDNTRLLVNVAGVYAVAFTFDVTPDGADTLRTISVIIPGAPQAVNGYIVDGIAVAEWQDIVALDAYHYAAGAVLTFQLSVTLTLGGMWSASNVIALLQRVA